MTVAAPKLDTVNDQVRGASSAAPAVGMDSMHIARAVGMFRRRARSASASRADPSMNVLEQLLPSSIRSTIKSGSCARRAMPEPLASSAPAAAASCTPSCCS